ncbi:MAG TPA: acetylxylan esterase [Acidimicrobiales bacterium]|nr:acetylxylan esterase [Acidimicrobiales bacterium]
MPYEDLPYDQLRSYSPELSWPADLEIFWKTTLEESRALVAPPNFTKVSTGLCLVDTFDVTFSGFGGHLVRGWMHVPANVTGPLPTVVRYQGYGGGRGLAIDVSPWALAGYATFVMDNRGQGSAWSPGDTPDPVGAAPSHPGFMTRGILDRNEYFYRRAFTDAVLAVDAVRAHPLVRHDRVAVTGGSQGGALTIAVAALEPSIWAAMPDVPFLCDFPRATEIVDTDPYCEIVRYLKVHRDQVDAVFSTLAYFDVAALAKLAQAPSLFSVALMDTLCPPSTVYAAFNRYSGQKQIVEYPFNDHEGGELYHRARQLQWLKSLV